MTNQDRAAFARGLVVLGEAFNEPVSDMRIEAYFDALSDLLVQDVLSAMRSAVRSESFFPKPVHLRNVVQGTTADRAELGWAEMTNAVRRFGSWTYPIFDDPNVMPTINALWGSWQRLCETLPAEGPELIGWRKSFLQAYGAHERRHPETKALPASVSDVIKQLAASKGMPSVDLRLVRQDSDVEAE